MFGIVTILGFMTVMLSLSLTRIARALYDLVVVLKEIKEMMERRG